MAHVTVKGTVSRTFFEGRGAEVTETFKKRDGSDGTTRWSAFFENEHGLQDGDVVEVSGLHGDKIDEWEKDGETRRTIKRSINKASLKSGGAVPVSAPQGDVWNTPGNYTEESPF